jgi:hypothetical protein
MSTPESRIRPILAVRRRHQFFFEVRDAAFQRGVVQHEYSGVLEDDRVVHVFWEPQEYVHRPRVLVRGGLSSLSYLGVPPEFPRRRARVYGEVAPTDFFGVVFQQYQHFVAVVQR